MGLTLVGRKRKTAGDIKRSKRSKEVQDLPELVDPLDSPVDGTEFDEVEEASVQKPQPVFIPPFESGLVDARLKLVNFVSTASPDIILMTRAVQLHCAREGMRVALLSYRTPIVTKGDARLM